MSKLTETLLWQIRDAGLPEPTAEVRFHPKRKWRFDFAWPHVKIAVEVEGGIWTGGRHTRGVGFEGDAEKYLQAVIHGWTVLRATGGTIKSGLALEALTAALSARLPLLAARAVLGKAMTRGEGQSLSLRALAKPEGIVEAASMEDLADVDR